MLKHVSNNPVGIVLITDIDTGKTLWEGEVRQCKHCQYTWKYKPGSGNLRGFCWKCNGHTCGRKQCESCYHKEKRVEDLEAIERRNRASIEAAVRQQDLREHMFSDIKVGLTASGKPMRRKV